MRDLRLAILDLRSGATIHDPPSTIDDCRSSLFPLQFSLFPLHSSLPNRRRFLLRAQPWHHRAQLPPGFLNRVLLRFLAKRLELAAFLGRGEPLAREGA